MISATRHRGATFVATRLRDYNGVVYRLSCVCFVCRTSDLLCDYILSFIRAKPKYARFVLDRESNK